MKLNINDFIYFERSKNGLVKVKHGIAEEGNIYQFLRNLGFRKCKIDNKRIYFRRDSNGLNPVNISDIRHAFRDFLDEGKYIGCPKDVTHQQIMNWFYSTNPIRENRLFNHYMEDIIKEEDTHLLKIKLYPMYRHRFEINCLLAKFNEWGFSKTAGSIGGSNANNQPLYYKQLEKNKFLVFNHWNADGKYVDGFDCWITGYLSEKHIGKIQPENYEDIRLGFNLNRDFHLIEHFIS